jgi:flagellar biosynthetic protein FliR
MITISSEMMQTWVISLLWPLTRILAVVGTAPVFSHRVFPVRSKVALAVMITLIVLPTLPQMPKFDVFSVQGLLLLAQQIIIGVAIGFSMRLFLAAIQIAGQMIAMTMGLGFATFFDPQTQGQTTSITQFINILTMLVFLSLDGHLMVISAVSQSFFTMPITLDFQGIDYLQVVEWGGYIFSLGLMLALPAVATLLIIQMALGVLTRTAPQLNIFGIGFPVTLSMGFLIILLTLPGMLKPIQNLIELGITNMQVISQTTTP